MDENAVYQEIQRAGNEARHDINPDARYVVIEYHKNFSSKEALKSDKTTAIERPRERVYKVSMLWSEFRHASLVVLKENDEQTGVQGARWHIGENELKQGHVCTSSRAMCGCAIPYPMLCFWASPP